jgi:hypothetical protein
MTWYVVIKRKTLTFTFNLYLDITALVSRCRSQWRLRHKKLEVATGLFLLGETHVTTAVEYCTDPVPGSWCGDWLKRDSLLPVDLDCSCTFRLPPPPQFLFHLLGRINDFGGMLLCPSEGLLWREEVVFGRPTMILH